MCCVSYGCPSLWPPLLPPSPVGCPLQCGREGSPIIYIECFLLSLSRTVIPSSISRHSFYIHSLAHSHSFTNNMNAAGNPYFTCHSSNTLFEQLPRRGLLDSSPNIKTRHAYYARPGPQHRICKTQSRAIVRQPYQSSRAPTTPTGSMSTEELEITKDAEFRQVWSKALTCQRYRNYRSKKRGCKTGDGEGCRAKDFAWPDEYEFAFWRGKVVPMVLRIVLF